MANPPEILLVGAADWLGASKVPRYASLAGARVSVLSHPHFMLAVSSYVSERIPAPEDADATLDRLRLHLETGRRYDWIVFTDDLMLDRAVERLDEAWLAPLLPARKNDREAARALISKSSFSRAMRACGVVVPDGEPARGGERIRAAAARVGFPVLVKPDRGFSGRRIFRADGAEELAALTATDPLDESIVERKIDGRVGATAVIFDQGRPSWWSSFMKAGVWPEPYGASCRRLDFEPSGIEEILSRIGEALGLHGFFGVDWILAPDGTLCVIELNGRPVPLIEGNHHVSQGLPDALRDFLAGRRAVRRPPPEAEAGEWHAMPQSFRLACAHRDWIQAAALLTGIGVRTDIPWDDWGLLKRRALQIGQSVIDVVRGDR
ncbi:MAG: ATP-grasp domain-containing protein [Elusimicrobiota bacterium]